MTENPEKPMSDMKQQMYSSLLSMSSELYASDSLFHTRATLAAAACSYALLTMDQMMTNEMYAVAAQAAAAALLLAKVPDEDIISATDQGAVAATMMEFAMRRAAVAKEMGLEGYEL